MSLSEDERRELERLRRHYRRIKNQEIVGEVLMIGLGLSLIVSCVIPSFAPFLRNHAILIVFICFATGLLLRHYASLKEKERSGKVK